MFLVVSQPRRFVTQKNKEIEGLRCLLGICPEFARNLPGIARNSEFARNLLGIRSENGPDQPCAELSSRSACCAGVRASALLSAGYVIYFYIAELDSRPHCKHLGGTVSGTNQPPLSPGQTGIVFVLLIGQQALKSPPPPKPALKRATPALKHPNWH